MRRLIACLLIAVLGTMPLLGMAKMASADRQGMQDMQDMQDMPCHQSAPKSDAGSTGDGDACKGPSHCCATFVLPAPAFSPPVETGAIRISGIQEIAAGIVITPLDPPPLTR